LNQEEKWARIENLSRTPVVDADIFSIMAEISELMGRDVGLSELAKPEALKEELFSKPKSRLVCVKDGITAVDR
jgi:hypothetical protein